MSERGVYRDAEGALLVRIEELQADAGRLRARITPELVAALPPELRGRLERLEGAIRSRYQAKEHRLAAEALEQYLGALGEVVRAAPALQEDWLAVPDEVVGEVEVEPMRGPELWLPWVRKQLERDVGHTWAKLRRCLRKLDPGAEVRWDLLTLHARLRVAGDPLALAACVRRFKNLVEIEIALATSVARAQPRLVLSPESVLTTFGKTLGIRREAELGDDGFDSLFFIEARTEDALRLLTPPVRKALLALGRFDLPRLTVEGGHATVRWCFDPEERALEAAVQVLATLRRTPVEVRMLLDEDD